MQALDDPAGFGQALADRFVTLGLHYLQMDAPAAVKASVPYFARALKLAGRENVEKALEFYSRQLEL